MRVKAENTSIALVAIVMLHTSDSLSLTPPPPLFRQVCVMQFIAYLLHTSQMPGTVPPSLTHGL